MNKPILRIAAILLPAVILCACGSTGPISGDQAASITAAAMTARRILSPLPPSATPTATETPLASPSLSPTLFPTSIPTRPAGPAEPLCDDSAYVSDVSIPDGTKMKPGEEFIKTWALRNTGTCTWTSAYALDLVSGPKMDGVITYVPRDIAPGEILEISIGLVAPSTAGTHTSNWRLKNADGKFFGDQVYVQIVVS